MLKILGYFTSIVLIILGITLLFEDDSLTRESLQEEGNKTIIIHKKSEIKRITETVDGKYKNKHGLEYY